MPLNIHDVLDRARRVAQAGFASHVRFSEEFDPVAAADRRRPDQLLQVFQNLAEERRRGGAACRRRHRGLHGLPARRQDDPAGPEEREPAAARHRDRQRAGDPGISDPRHLRSVRQLQGQRQRARPVAGVEVRRRPWRRGRMRQPARAHAFPGAPADLAGQLAETRGCSSRSWKAPSSSPTTTAPSAPCWPRRSTRAGCRVRATGTASTLWRWIDEGEGDVVVTDVMMPDGDALDLLPAIKKRRPDLPVIVMSAQNTVMTAIRAAEVGAYEYLPKPFDLKEVLSQRLQGAEPQDPPPGAARRRACAPRGQPAADRPQPGDAGSLPHLARLMNTDLGGDDHRRERHRQGAGRPRAPRSRPAPGRPVRRRSTGGDPARR